MWVIRYKFGRIKKWYISKKNSTYFLIFFFTLLVGCSSSESESTTITDQFIGNSYTISNGNDYVKWVQYGTDNELGSRPDNGTWDTDNTQMTGWKIVSALDASSGTYSLQSVYDTSYYINTVVYESNTDKAHVYDPTVETTPNYSFEIVDASTIPEFSDYSGYVIYYTEGNTNYYLIPMTVSSKDLYFMDTATIGSESPSYSDAVFTLTEYSE